MFLPTRPPISFHNQVVDGARATLHLLATKSTLLERSDQACQFRGQA